jgi:hypothetical protein
MPCSGRRIIASIEPLRRPHRVAPPRWLLSPIMDRVRQRPVMILDPCKVENIDKAAADPAALESFGLGQRPGRRAHVFPARE